MVTVQIKRLFTILALLAVQAAGGPLLAQSLPGAFDVLNATSFQRSLSPGVVAVVVGENLTPGEQIGCAFADGSGWNNNLRGVEVLVNQKAAPIGAHCRVPQSDGLVGEVITCQFPMDLQPGAANLVVRVNGQVTANYNITVQAHAPALDNYFTATGQQIGAFQRVLSGQLVSADAPAIPGELLAILTNGLGPTNPPVAAGTRVDANDAAPQVVAKPILEIGGQQVEIVTAALRPGFVGAYAVAFRFPGGLPTGYYRTRLRIGSDVSNEALLVGGSIGGPFIRAIVSAGSFAPNQPIASGSILSLFMSGMEGESNLGLFPSTTDHAGLAVEFDGVRGPLFAVVPEAGQINVFAPAELAESGSVDVRVITAGSSSGPYPLNLTASSPGIFRIIDPADSKRQFASAYLANTAWMAIPNSVAGALGLPIACESLSPAAACGHPIRAGEMIQIYLTGLGRATPGGDPASLPLTTGLVAPVNGSTLYQTPVLPEVWIGDVPAVVAYSGLVPGFAGLYQINATVPLDAPSGDDVPLRISASSGLSDTALIAIE